MSTPSWAPDAVVYHYYPLGATGAPARNDGRSHPVPRLDEVRAWIPHWQALGVNTIYFGPLLESGTHGYDTTDYFQVDRRLGTHETFAALSAALHAQGFRVILDAVLNHVGRDFWAFRHVREHGAASPYAGWFSGLRFDRRSPLGDPFDYDTWAGHHELVKLNLAHPEVRRHLFEAVTSWIETFGLDGLRLDAADVMDLGFLRDLAAHCRALKPDFWLLGEVVHGDYARWAGPGMLDAVTNYEAYKGLYSSLNDRNYFEIAHTLDRQFGPRGVYRGLPLKAFVDNHDVERIASRLARPAHLFPLHVLLFTMPGVPAIYYGSEWAVPGRKAKHTDAPLRPALRPRADEHPLASAIARLSRVRAGLVPLRHGDYRTLHVASEQFAFQREAEGGRVVVALNASDQPASVTLELPGRPDGTLVDVLDGTEAFALRGGRATIPLHPSWGRVLALR